MSCRSRTSIQKFVVYHLIFFFILTPFLASCGGGGSSDGSVGPTPTEAATVADAAESQNRSAQTAISDALEMTEAFVMGLDLIEGVFGTLNPATEDILNYYENNPEEAAALLAQLEALSTSAKLAAESFVASIEKMKEKEEIISNAFDNTDSTTSGTYREAQAPPLITAAGVLALLTVFGMMAAVYVAVVPAANEGIEDESPQGLERSIRNWDDVAEEGLKATTSSGATSIFSWAAGIQQWKTVKFIIDVYGAYDSGSSISEAFAMGWRSCDSNESLSLNTSFRKSMDIDFESLTPDDLYIGTPDDTGTFHNVPSGNWTFLLFADGHLRTVTQCIDVTGPSPIEVHVTPVPIGEIDELLENTPDEIVACNDRSECEDGYFCYLGFCEPEDEWLGGSSDYFGHWHIVEENTTSLSWYTDIQMFPTGRYVMQVWLWGTELGGQTRGSWGSTGSTLLLIADDGSEVISGQVHWENENDFWQTGTWVGSAEQKRFAWLKQEVDEDDEDDDCPCDGPTCPTRCP